MSDNDRKTAGAFDVRNIIGGLLTVYGVILLLMGLFGDTGPASPDAPSGADVNANLWTGIGLLVAGLLFIAWWRLRPLAVPDDVEANKDVDRPDV